MKIISFDVGIKNLAFCLLSDKGNKDTEGTNEKENSYSSFHIVKWDILNIGQENDDYKCIFLEKNQCCNKPAKFMKQGETYCLKHGKKQTQHQIPTSELNIPFLKKQKVSDLIALAKKYNIKYETTYKKQDILQSFQEYIYASCLEPIVSKDASNVNLIDIGKNIKKKLDALFESVIEKQDKNEKIIDCVLIENQISPIANRMKTIQGMLAQYFIMKEMKPPHIEFVSSLNKLKDDTKKVDSSGSGDKKAYQERKKRSIQRTEEWLEKEIQLRPWKQSFLENKKKDDLADSFLQAWWYIQNKLKK
jgi:hypothetical protein